jgi:3-oxoacyl-[acyl-carrier protein] reductase
MHWEVRLDANLVAAFAKATGDFSPIHTDAEFARKTRFREPIVHGMLPLVLVLARACYEERQDDAVRLVDMSCRFTGATKIGDRIHLDAVKQATDGERETWELAARQADGGTPVFTGNATLVRCFDRPNSSWRSADSVLVRSVEVLDHTVSDIKMGMTETLALRPEPSALQGPLRLLDRQLGVSHNPTAFNDRAAAALVALSTLIGMRLPGRYATFLDFEATFPDPVGDGDLRLEGKVADILPARSRMRQDVRWLQGSNVVGTGTATTMIGEPPEPPLSCAAIKADRLSLGIEGKVALVTGASRGIGEATAKALAMCGARVAVHFFRGEGDARAIVDDIRSSGGTAFAVRADLTDRASVSSLFSAVEAELGAVDILVNNAVGDFLPKPIEELRVADYLGELNISLFGMHECCLRALPHMRRQRWGKIINLGTIATEVPVASQSKYITAKSAIVGYTRSLAVETAADNIQVNLVVPSMTQTSLIAGLPRVLVERLAEDNPTGSLLQPIDVAKVIVFLASDWASCITGQQSVLNAGGPPFL